MIFKSINFNSNEIKRNAQVLITCDSVARFPQSTYYSNFFLILKKVEVIYKQYFLFNFLDICFLLVSKIIIDFVQV